MAMRKRQYAYLLEMDNQFEQAIEFAERRHRARACRRQSRPGERNPGDSRCMPVQPWRRRRRDRRLPRRTTPADRRRRWNGWLDHVRRHARPVSPGGRTLSRSAPVAGQRARSRGRSTTGFARNATPRSRTASSRSGRPRARTACSEARRPSRCNGARPMAERESASRARRRPSDARAARRTRGGCRRSPRSERLLWQVPSNSRDRRSRDGGRARAGGRRTEPGEAHLLGLPARQGGAGRRATARRPPRPRPAPRTRWSEDLDRHPAIGLSPAEYWWILFQAFEAAGATPAARAALGRGAEWLRATAHDHVAEEFRDSFLTRNPLHRAVLTTATRMPP